MIVVALGEDIRASVTETFGTDWRRAMTALGSPHPILDSQNRDIYIVF